MEPARHPFPVSSTATHYRRTKSESQEHSANGVTHVERNFLLPYTVRLSPSPATGARVATRTKMSHCLYSRFFAFAQNCSLFAEKSSAAATPIAGLRGIM